MIFPHLMDVYEITYGQDNSAGLTRDAGAVFVEVECFDQPSPSANDQPNLKSQVEKQDHDVYFHDCEVFNTIMIDWLIKLDNKFYQIKSKENFCGLNRIFGIGVSEYLVQDI